MHTEVHNAVTAADQERSMMKVLKDCSGRKAYWHRYW